MFLKKSKKSKTKENNFKIFYFNKKILANKFIKNDIKIIKLIDLKNEKSKKHFIHLFPKIKNKKINYYNLKITNIGYYSMTKNEISKLIILEIFNYLTCYKLNINKLIITDALANCGGMTLIFAQYFFKVNAVEIIPLQANILKNNIIEYGFKNVEVYAADYLKTNLVQDVIFFDPPWMNINYKMLDNIDLFINNINILVIINEILNKKKTKFCILYAPHNYNLTSIKSFVPNHKIKICKIIDKFIIFFSIK